MSEAPYINNINWISFYRNIMIAGGVIALSLILFYLIWLKSPFLQIQTPQGMINTSNLFKFLVIQNRTVWSTNNQSFWLNKASLEGYTYILFLQSQITMFVLYLISISMMMGFWFLWKKIVSLENSENVRILYF